MFLLEPKQIFIFGSIEAKGSPLNLTLLFLYQARRVPIAVIPTELVAGPLLVCTSLPPSRGRRNRVQLSFSSLGGPSKERRTVVWSAVGSRRLIVQ